MGTNRTDISVPDNKIIFVSKYKPFADNTLNVAQPMKTSYDMFENIMLNGESTVFSTDLFSSLLNHGIM